MRQLGRLAPLRNGLAAVSRHVHLPTGWLQGLLMIAALAAGTLGVAMLLPAPKPPRPDVVAVVGSTPFQPVHMPAVQPASPPLPTAVAAAEGGGVAAPPSPPAPPTRGALIRALQTALTNADCYDGPIHGYWTRETKDAMGRFVGGVNARLPVEQPDEVLLGLMKSHPKATCPEESDEEQTAAATPATTPEPPKSFAELVLAPDVPLPVLKPKLDLPPTGAAEAATAVPNPAAPSTAETAAALAAGAVVAAGVSPAIAAVQPQTSPGSTTDDDRRGTAESERRSETARRNAESETETTRSRPLRTAASERPRTRRKSTALDGVSRSITRNFRSLQRSLGTLF